MFVSYGENANMIRDGMDTGNDSKCVKEIMIYEDTKEESVKGELFRKPDHDVNK